MIKYTEEEFKAEGEKRFGKDLREWRFVCPRCQTEQTMNDLLKLMDKDEVVKFIAYSCIGRFEGSDKGCDWTLGGFFKIHEMMIIDKDGKEHPHFKFAEI